MIEEYESLDPVNVAFFSFVTIMPRADRPAYLVEQFRLLNRWHHLTAGFGVQPSVDHSKRAICRRGRVDVIHNGSPCVMRMS